ncbi:hypothetical protein [Dyella sp. ASV21]|uniref:hypothetical protein n=1 Tax=Dyella sp. ASV21 TaxID=2795114 RepID=UPI0018EDC09C|nr:hypothetical protein [Dyella sp. ASV21]
MSERIELPAAFMDSEEFQALPEDQRLSFLRRLDNAKSLGLSLESGSRLANASDFADFTEDLELDASLLQELDSAAQGGLSRWLLHFSWSFETSPGEMLHALPAFCLGLLDTQEPRHDATLDSYRSWFHQVGVDLVRVTHAIESSNTYEATLALHIVVDVLLGRLLVACHKLRLNSAMPR